MQYVKYLLLGLCFSLSPVFADGMRCGNSLVVTGDSKMEVLKKCGEPQFTETTKLLTKSKQITLRDQNRLSPSKHLAQGQMGTTLTTETTETVEQWTYNLGSTQFIKVLTFRAGRLESVQETERGYTESD